MEISGYFATDLVRRYAWPYYMIEHRLPTTIYVCERCGAFVGGKIPPEEIKRYKKSKEKEKEPKGYSLERTITLKPVLGINP